MNIQEFLSIGVVGVFLSLVIEGVSKYSKSVFQTKVITLVLALAFGGAYVWLRSTPFFPTVITVLGVASIVYGFFFNKKSE